MKQIETVLEQTKPLGPGDTMLPCNIPCPSSDRKAPRPASTAWEAQAMYL